MSLRWSDPPPGAIRVDLTGIHRPTTAQVRAAILLLLLAAVVVGCFLWGQARQDSWCRSHPGQAVRAEQCQGIR